jgi:hypothetical protein
MASAHDSAEESVDPPLLSKHGGHPFAAGARGAACALCGESATHILHHPTRIRAACALLGIDPEPLLARPKC